MKYLLVPRGASAKHVTLWAAALRERPGELPGDAHLNVEGRSIPVAWAAPTTPALAGLDGAVHTAELPDIPVSRRSSEIALLTGTKRETGAVAGALPARLPGAGEKPFTILLGSCYGAHRDAGRRVATAYDHLCKTGAAPDVKFLCGDQVYLDHPARYAQRPHTALELRDKFLSTYRRSWSEDGLLPLLRRGANYLTADDHEFWNEFPSHFGVRGRTQTWRDLALALFRLFQSPQDTHTLRVDPVQLFVLDTCVNRSPTEERPRKRFCAPSALQQLRTWVAGLTGPGVLVLGEPLLGERWTLGAAAGRQASRLVGQPTIAGTIRDYEQYRELTGILAGSAQTIVVLGGDVHWGRMAQCRLPSGARLIEIVSSPLTLADGGISRWFRPWTPAPSHLLVPGGRGPRVVAIRDRADPAGRPYRTLADHFVTLELTAAGSSVNLEVRRWLIDVPHGGEVVYRTDLTRRWPPPSEPTEDD